MKNNLKKTGYALLVALTFFACKKDQKQTDLAADAKNWYLKSSQQTSYSLKSSRNETLKVSQQADWDNAETFQLSDGTEVLGVPLSFKSADDKMPKGSYLLMISRSGESFKKLTVYNEEKEFYKNVSKDKVQSAYNLGNQLLQLQKKANNNHGRGKIMSEDNGTGEGDQPVCIDWYLIETYRDADGNVTQVVETYMGQTCYSTSSSGGGGGSSGDEGGGNVNIEWGSADDTPISETVMNESDTIQYSNVAWYCYTAHNGAIKFKSYETVKAKVIKATVWGMTQTKVTMLNTIHVSMASEGTITGQDISPIFGNALDQTTDELAKIKITFKDRRQYIKNGTTHYVYSDDILASMSRNAVQLGFKK